VKNVSAGQKRWTAALQVMATSLTMPLLLQVTYASPARAEAKSSRHGQTKAESLSFEPFAKNAGIVGLNYIIGTGGYPVVSDIYKDGPADRAGVKSGDEIVAVSDGDTSDVRDARDARYIGYLHLQALLTGESGTKVSLKIRRSGGTVQTLSITRASVESFKDPNLLKYDVAKWAGPSDTKINEADRPAENRSDHLPDHLPDHLIDLPFAMLSREHNKPTLFEFTDKLSDGSVLELLKKHRDGSYLLSQCKVERITKDDPSYDSLVKYLGLSGSYGLIPVYQPWLVTVRQSDVITALPTESQLNDIARRLVHNSIEVQVSHTVAKQKGAPEAGQKLNKRAGLSHKTVLKRICQAIPPGDGIVGLGFAAGVGGYATITQVFAGGPAEKASLKAGDQIILLDGQDTRFIGLEHIQAALTGPTGHSVTLQVRTPGPKGKGAAVHETRKISLQFEPLNTFNDPNLTKITVSRWKRVLSSNVDDSDEYELPCCMLALALDRPTIFEFCSSETGPSVNETVAKMRASRKSPDPLPQIIRYTPANKNYQTLRAYFNITSNYACLPVYYKGKHKTVKARELLPGVPSEKDLEQAIEKVSPSQPGDTKTLH
jgi:hypothetical protein